MVTFTSPSVPFAAVEQPDAEEGRRRRRPRNEADGAGNSLDTAKDLGNLQTSKMFSDFVGTKDPFDYYKFELTASTNVKCVLDGLGDDADMALLDRNGKVLNIAQNPGRLAEILQYTLKPDKYFVVITNYENKDQGKSTNTKYNLNIQVLGGGDDPGDWEDPGWFAPASLTLNESTSALLA